MQKQYIEVPLSVSIKFCYKVYLRTKNIILSPIYLLRAYMIGGIDMTFRLKCVVVGMRLLLLRRAPMNICYRLIFCPMDSTRYFEFYEAWKCIEGQKYSRHLDVSSPRLFPVSLLLARRTTHLSVLNPDVQDIQETKNLISSLRLDSSCDFFNGIPDNAKYDMASFDLITCISVLEHIPEDKRTLDIIWGLVAPGGKLILTVPCMAHPLEQYISNNPYGVLKPGENGYTFWQRYYDTQRLEEIYRVTGKPVYKAIYGEKTRGLFFRNASMKRLMGVAYSFWREPYMMATEYKAFSKVSDLPGEGVIVLEFVKPGIAHE